MTRLIPVLHFYDIYQAGGYVFTNVSFSQLHKLFLSKNVPLNVNGGQKQQLNFGECFPVLKVSRKSLFDSAIQQMVYYD